MNTNRAQSLSSYEVSKANADYDDKGRSEDVLEEFILEGIKRKL